MTKLAIIDLGSNSTRMTISQVNDDGSYEVIHRDQSMVRLSEGMGSDKVLQPKAMERTIQVMQEFAEIAQKYKADKIIPTATAAVRQATNKAEFIQMLADQTGLKLRVLTGLEEAHYDYLAIIHTLPISDALIIDTGGGSVELVYVQSTRMVQSISVPIGSVNLTEAYLEKDKISAKGLFTANLAIERQFSNVPWLQNARHLPIVALGGSNRTFAKISRRFRNVMDLPIHGYRLTAEDVFDIFQAVLPEDMEGRKKIPGLAKDRADIIVGGMLPLVNAMQYIDATQVIFSQAGLREGIVFEYIQQKTGLDVVTPMPEDMTIDDDVN
ncbi:MAG: exopolyphosphatase [Lactobacillaceae bacterium]|jgi:exopolyphosphatase/guanosine-5'-triphosphate,3'-diphosphate pyrophosphatase|nr:exopolyphosphatase [Lactobacillaceae bacterium]